MRPAIGGAALVFAAVLSACGSDELAPQVTDLRYVDQVPQRPLVLRFDVTFTDADGDLGLGTLHLLLDGEERSELSMDEVFAAQVPSLPRDSTQGHFQVLIELDPPIADGREIEVGLWLVDRAGAQSNEPSVTLRAAELSVRGES